MKFKIVEVDPEKNNNNITYEVIELSDIGERSIRTHGNFKSKSQAEKYISSKVWYSHSERCG